MFEDHLRYDRLIDSAMRDVVKQVLNKVGQEGLIGHHHFLLSFLTTYPGAFVPPRLISRYPEEMTIVLQHQYEDLQIHDSYFSVVLSFDGIKEKIVIPFESLTSFADPGVKFGLKFNLVSEQDDAEVNLDSDETYAFDQGDDDSELNKEEEVKAEEKKDNSANSNVVSLNFSKDK